MTNPNDLERAIVNAAEKAQESYQDMTGWWLLHGPESFLQIFLSLKLMKRLDINVYPECSPKRLKRDCELTLRGRPPKINEKQRFDVVLWWKNEKPRAIVEVKCVLATGGTVGVVNDAKKLFSYSAEAKRIGLRSGYLLVYVEAYHKKEAKSRAMVRAAVDAYFDKVERECGKATKGAFSLVSKTSPRYSDEPDDKGQTWAYGFALLRMDFST